MVKFFYQLSPQESLQELKVDLKMGLSKDSIERRREHYGLNKLAELRRRPIFFRFTDQFKDLLSVILMIAAGLAYYLDDFRGGTILIAIVLINAVIGFYQEYKAERILESLKKIIKTKATVRRDGEEREIDEIELVPGDIVILEEGSAVPADIRLIETNHFSTNDFILTGESTPQEKWADLVIKKSTTITNRDNLVFMGTSVAKGSAVGVVFGTGMDTAIGRIAHETQKIENTLSPLQIEINALAKTLTKIAGIIAAVMFVLSFLIHYKTEPNFTALLNLSFLFAIGIAASMVPQGLPAQVSVALSLGVGRLAGKKAIVKKLSAVETLGSTSVVCSDKTGTITKNEMTITHCYVNGRTFEISGIGYDPKGFIFENEKKITPEKLLPIKQFFEDGFLASHGRVHPPDDEHSGWYSIGDPTECAFMPLAIKAGLNPEILDKSFPKIDEIPFDSDRKRMTVIRKHKGKIIGYMKGSLESVLQVCTHMNEGGILKKLNPYERKKILSEGAKFEAQALRVIGLAYRDFPKGEKKFIFSGFVAMIDPPRNGVKEAIASAYDSHIRIMMITGDNAITAEAIANRIKIKSKGKAPKVFTGDEIKRMTNAKLKGVLQDESVIFSRVSPQDKYRIVSLLKEMKEVVAVTGDGVNDTLSLKRADIGVAMGKMGSEVAKEAAEIVLLDDNFKTLVVAIKEGRTIFKNLAKNLYVTITSNIGELTCVLLGFLGLAFSLPIPITAVQILCVDLVGEMLPIMALTFDPAEDEIMRQKPRDLSKHVINKKSLISIAFYGFWMGAAGYFSFLMVHLNGGSLASAQAAAYAGIMVSVFVNIFSRRSNHTLFSAYLFNNKQILWSLLLSIGLVLMLIYMPFINVWIGFEPIPLKFWIYPLWGGLFMLALHEIRKVIQSGP